MVSAERERLPFSEIETGSLPKHLVFIPDGNRRWAREKGLPEYQGHIAGMKRVKELILACRQIGITTVTIWAFSTENWDRTENEVSFLMRAFENFLDENLEEINGMGANLRWLGNRQEKVSEKFRRKIEEAERLTASNSQYQLNIALNYGSRDEIVRAVKKIIKSGVGEEEIDWELIADYLDTAGLDDPDLIIRTGEKTEKEGETIHTSGLLALQTTYGRWYVTDTLCPDFSEAELTKALKEFAKSKPRFGR